MSPIETVISIDEAARLLGITARRVSAMLADGTIARTDTGKVTIAGLLKASAASPLQEGHQSSQAEALSTPEAKTQLKTVKFNRRKTFTKGVRVNPLSAQTRRKNPNWGIARVRS